jgi:hypothetical protein
MLGGSDMMEKRVYFVESNQVIVIERWSTMDDEGEYGGGNGRSDIGEERGWCK